MADYENDHRLYAVAMGRRYLNGTLTAEAFIEMFGDTSDPLVHELLDHLLHRPTRSGLLQSSDREIQSFVSRAEELFGELEKGDEGKVPHQGRIKLWWLLLAWGLFLPFVAASAAEHLSKVVLHVLGKHPISIWELVGNAIGGAFMSVLTVLVFRALIYGTRRYRAQQARRRAI